MIMRRTSIILSVLLHIAIVVISIVGLPFVSAREFVIPPAPIVIDYVEMSAVTETTKVALKPTKKKPSKVDAPPPMPSKKPKPTAKNTSSKAAAPAKGKAGASSAKSDVVKGVPLPAKKGEKKKVETVKSKATGGENFSSVLKNLMEAEEEETFSGEGFNAPLGAKITISEQDALRAQLEKCWNVPIGARDAENMTVEIIMIVNKDRTLRDAKIVDSSRYNTDHFFRAVADSAIRAVRSPLCSPFELPEDKYEVWKRTIVRFNARDMF